MAREHRIDAARQLTIAVQYALAHPFIPAVGPQAIELVVEVEDERRLAEAARGARRLRVKADDEKGLAPETQREMGIVGLGANAGINRHSLPRILVLKALVPGPKRLFHSRPNQDIGR